MRTTAVAVPFIFLLIKIVSSQTIDEDNQQQQTNDAQQLEEEDPLMAPLNNGNEYDEPSQSSPPDPSEEFAPIPQMADLIDGSDHVMRDEHSRVRLEIHMMMANETDYDPDANKIPDEFEFEQEKKSNDDKQIQIFNTDDFDDPFDDEDASDRRL